MFFMRRFRLVLQYDGTDFAGWQSQAQGERTIQDTLADAIQAVTGLYIRPAAAGRTDAGVHALGQVAAFSAPWGHGPDALLRALNAHLPRDIRVVETNETTEDFDARRGARGKRYRYLIMNGPTALPFSRAYSWLVPQPLDVAAMRRGAKVLVGRHDFSSFRASGCTAKNPVRTLRTLTVLHDEKTHFFGLSLPGPLITIVVEGDAFLRHMVRAIAGTLVDVGRGRISSGSLAAILADRDRNAAGPTAPPEGLFLETVFYDE